MNLTGIATRTAAIGLALAATAFTAAFAQDKGAITWPDGKKAAIALTYDDSLDSHLDIALPALDERGLKGTFFLTINGDAYVHRLDEWKGAAKDGHELANHTLFHPCRGGPGRDWVQPQYDMRDYSVARMAEEIQLTNDILAIIDGEAVRTFAYTCGDTTVSGDESIVEAIKPLVIAARGTQNGIAGTAETPVDPYRIPNYGPEGATGAQLIAYGEDVLEAGGLGTFIFHGVGGDYLQVSAEAHAELLDWLAAHEDEIWVTTFREMMEYVNAQEDGE